MQLQLGIFIQFGQKSSLKSGSLPSTQASTSRAPNPKLNRTQSRDQVSKTSSDISMSMEVEQPFSPPDTLGLDYNTKPNFQGINNYHAKIYKDNQGKYVVKIKDHPSPYEPHLMANYQGDGYMAPHGVMYLVIEEPNIEGQLGRNPCTRLKHPLEKKKRIQKWILVSLGS